MSVPNAWKQMLRWIAPLLLLVLVLFSAVTLSPAQGIEQSCGALVGQPYAMSVQPDYADYTAAQKRQLTDGNAASSWYLRDSTALGWKRKSPVVVTFGFEKPKSIDRLRVQAAAKARGHVHYPSQLLVYGGRRDKLMFLGASQVNNGLETPQSSTLKVFDIAVSPQPVERLVIVSLARGPFLFLGEVDACLASKTEEASSANSDTAQPVAGGFVSDIVSDAVERRRAAIAALTSRMAPTGPASWLRWGMPLDNAGMTQRRKAANRECIIEAIEPWPDNTGADRPLGGHTELVTTSDAPAYKAFRITNVDRSPLKVKLSQRSANPKASPESGSNRTTITTRYFALANVQAQDLSWHPDAAVPFTEGPLQPGNEMLVLAELTASTTGHHVAQIEVACGATVSSFVQKVTTVPGQENGSRLSGNLWPYIHFKRHEPIARGLACNPNMLADWSIDTAHVHPDALFARDGIRPTELLRRYFQAFGRSKRLLLFMDLKTGRRPWKFLQQPEAEALRSLQVWWGWVAGIAREEGVTAELQLFPMDEPKQVHVATLKRAVHLMRKAKLPARIYTTLEYRYAREIAPLMDVVQLRRPTASHVTSIRAMGVQEVHGYDTRFDARTLPVETYYLLQGWRAFNEGLDGIGIWALWDTRGYEDTARGWDLFGVPQVRDFAMMYAGADGCGWPSRRLLAWARGIGENAVLRACAKSLGRKRLEGMISQALRSGPAKRRRVLSRCGAKPAVHPE